MGYREDLEINTNKLDEEWLNHAQKFMDYVELAADAEYEKNMAAQNRTNVRAEVARKIRASPKKYKIDGLPATAKEQAIKGLVEEHKKVRKADREYFLAIRNHHVMEKAEHSMGSYRKSALENLTARYQKGYWAEPHYIGGDVDKNIKRKDRREGVRMRQSLKRKLKMRRKNG